jgi:hypothetical protein
VGTKLGDKYDFTKGPREQGQGPLSNIVKRNQCGTESLELGIGNWGHMAKFRKRMNVNCYLGLRIERHFSYMLRDWPRGSFAPSL